MKAKIKKNKNNDYYTQMKASNGKDFEFEATPADVITGKHLRDSNYYKPNQHYPQKICGNCLMDMAIKVQQYMIELLNDDGTVGIEEITALRSLDAIVHERTKEIVEDFAKDMADDYDTKPYEKKPKFDVGDVVKFDAKEYDGNWKHGVIVEANDDGTYAVFVGHTTLGGLTEPILYDMLGIEKYKK